MVGHRHRSLALFLLLPFLIIVAQNVLHGLVQCKHQTEHARQEQNLKQDTGIIVTEYVLGSCTSQAPDRTCSTATKSTTGHILQCNTTCTPCDTACTPWSRTVQTPDRRHSTGTESATRHMHHCEVTNTKQNMLDRNRI